MRRWNLVLLFAIGLWWPTANAAPPTPTSRPAAPQALPQPTQGQIFIGLPRLQRLLRTHKHRKYNAVIPHKAVYRGRLQKGWLRLTAQLRLRRTSLSPQQAQNNAFAIGGKGGIIYNVRLQGQPHAPRRDAWGTHWVELPPTLAEITLTFQYGLKVPTARGEHKLQLDLPACPQATLALQFAGKGWEAHTTPASQVQHKERKAGTQATLQLPAEGLLWLMWKGKRIERKEKTRYRARVETLLTLQEGLLQGQSRLHLEVLTGSLRSVQFTMPARVELLHVGGPGVVEWFLTSKGKDTQTYTVQLSRAIRKTQQLKLRFEQIRKNKQPIVLLPQVQVTSAEHAGLFVGVLAKADTEVSHEQVSQGQQVDVRSLPQRIRSQSSLPILLAYRSAHPNPKIHVKLVRHPQLQVMHTVINSALFETVRTRDGSEVVKATYWVTNNRRQFMPIELPKGAAIIGAFVAGHPVQPALQEKGVARTSMGQLITQRKRTYLLPLVRSSRKQSKRSFPVEILYRQDRQKMKSFGLITSKLPVTPIQILSYQWNYYLPKSHKHLWLAGTARSTLRGRFLHHLMRRMDADLRSGTPVLWAGGGWRKNKRSKLNVYNFKGLKERFAAPMATPDNWHPARARRSKYKSRFAQTQWQVAAKIPLVGHRLTFRGHLVRNNAPLVQIWYLRSDLTRDWFWVVLALTMLGGILFLSGLFAKGPVRWGRVIFALLIWAALFGAGYVMPMTYLAGFRGLLFGFWGAILLGLATIPEERRWVGVGYLRFARGAAVAITFLLLLFGGVNMQIACLFLALPVYPAIVRKRQPQEGGAA